jgi:hypothetical protein
VQPDNGWPKGSAIEPATLAVRLPVNAGVSQLALVPAPRRWTGHVDLRSHQLDIYNWFRCTPCVRHGQWGIDYYDRKGHEWYDSVLATLEYNTPGGKVRAFYQTISTNSNQGYYESFMGDQGTLIISESGTRGAAYREPTAPEWNKWVSLGYLKAPVGEQQKPQADSLLDVGNLAAIRGLPTSLTIRTTHISNFFDNREAG